MAQPSNAKKKVPHTAAHLLAIEDQLERIKAIYREIRHGMESADVQSVELATGTAMFYLSEVEGFAERHRGEFHKQKALAHANKTRERIAAEIHAGQRQPKGKSLK
jgi:hypothetical protein